MNIKFNLVFVLLLCDGCLRRIWLLEERIAERERESECTGKAYLIMCVVCLDMLPIRVRERERERETKKKMKSKTLVAGHAKVNLGNQIRLCKSLSKQIYLLFLILCQTNLQ